MNRNSEKKPGRGRAKGSAAPLALLTIAFCLGGCAARPKPLYQWESYQSQVYQYLKGQSSDPQKQIASMEQDFQKIQAQSLKAPPGFHAHLGLLYASVGKDDAALQEFQTEKALFPESAPYIDTLLVKATANKEKAL